MPSIQRQATTTDNPANWFNTSAVITNAGQYAHTDTDNMPMAMWGHAFGSLPASVTIDGIIVTLDAYKDVTAGSGTLRFDVLLSWDGGSSWTAAKTTANLTTTETTLQLGGATDNWGRTWTRTEIVSNFRVRVTSKSAGDVLDDPQWRIDWAHVTVYYTDTGAIDLVIDEPIGIADSTQTSSIEALILDESIGIADRSELPKTEDMQFSGTAEEAAQSTPGISDLLADGRVVRQGFAVKFFSSADLMTIGDGEAGRGPGTDQVGLVELIELRSEGRFGAAAERATCRFTISRAVLRTIVGGEGPFEQLIQTKNFLTFGQVPIEVLGIFSDDAGVVYQKILFRGYADDAEIGEELVEIGLRAEGREWDKIPLWFVQEELLNYGSSEGNFPKEWSGAPIPIGYGRFWLGAFLKEDLSSDITSLLRGSHFGSLLGIKVPALPVTVISEGYTGPADNSPPVAPLAGSVPQILVAFGDRQVVTCEVRTSATATENMGRGGWSATNDYQQFYSAFISWDSSQQRAIVYGRDESPEQLPNETLDFLTPAGCGDVRSIYPAPFQASGARAANCSVGFFNAGQPTWFNNPQVSRWSGLIGFIALPYVGISSAEPYVVHSTRLERLTPGLGGPGGSDAPIGTKELLRRLGSTNPKDAIEIHDVNLPGGTPGNVSHNGGLSLQAPPSAPALGYILVVRHAMLLSTALDQPGGRALALKMRRTLPRPNLPQGVIWQPWGGINVVEHTSGGTQYMRTISDQVTFATAAYTPIRPNVETDPAKLLEREWDFEAPWQFTHRPSGTGVIQSYAVDCAMLPQFTNNPLGTAARASLVKAWFEVCFQANITTALRLPAMSAYLVTQPKSERPGLVSGFVAAGVAIATSQWQAVPGALAAAFTVRQGGRRITPVRYTGNVREPEMAAQVSTPLFVHGDGPNDVLGAGTGKYTGSTTPSVPASWSAMPVIERPVDIIGHMMDKFIGGFDSRPIGSSFGSFITARTAQNLYRMVVPIAERMPMQAFWDRIGTQSEAFYQRQITDTGPSEIRCFVDDPDPATNQPGRMFRADAFKFRWRDIVPGSFKMSPTPRDQIPHSYTLHYGLHLPSGTFAFKMYVTPTSTNMLDSQASYKTACVNAKNNGSYEEFSFEAPDIWDEQAANRLLKYMVDSRHKQRWQIEFTTFAAGLELRPGHVIRFDDSIASPDPALEPGAIPVHYPGQRTPSNWAAQQWDVMSLTTRKAPGEPFLVDVIVMETYRRVT